MQSTRWSIPARLCTLNIRRQRASPAANALLKTQPPRARPCAGHPRLSLRCAASEDVDGRAKPGQGVWDGLDRRAGGQRRVMRGGSRRYRRRQVTRNRRAGARPRLDLDRPTMQFDEALDQGQAEPRAGFARLRVAALELLENALLI